MKKTKMSRFAFFMLMILLVVIWLNVGNVYLRIHDECTVEFHHQSNPTAFQKFAMAERPALYFGGNSPHMEEARLEGFERVAVVISGPIIWLVPLVLWGIYYIVVGIWGGQLFIAIGTIPSIILSGLLISLILYFPWKKTRGKKTEKAETKEDI